MEKTSEAWQKMVQPNDRWTHQQALNQLVQLLNVDLLGDLEDKTLLWKRMIKTEKVFVEDFRIGIWLANALERAIKTHLLIRAELVRWADVRQDDVVCESPQSLCGFYSPNTMHRGFVLMHCACRVVFHPKPPVVEMCAPAPSRFVFHLSVTSNLNSTVRMRQSYRRIEGQSGT